MNLQDQELDKARLEIALGLADAAVDAAKTAYRSAKAAGLSSADLMAKLQGARAEQTNIIAHLTRFETKLDRLGNEKLMSVLAVLQADMWALTTPDITDTQLRNSLLEFYKVHPGNETTFVCSVLGSNVPMESLTCCHIFPRRWAPRCTFIGLEHIDCPTNLMLLLKPIERLFCQGKWCIVFDVVLNAYVCYILDPKLKDKNVRDALRKCCPFMDMKDIDLKNIVTFGDLHMTPLSFPNNALPHQPSIRIHALLATDGAIQRGWIKSEDLSDLDNDALWPRNPLSVEQTAFIKQWRNDII